MKQFSDNLNRRLTGIVKLIKGNGSGKKPKAGAKPADNDGNDKSDHTYYKCDEPGHFTNKCPDLAAKETVVFQPKSENGNGNGPAIRTHNQNGQTAVPWHFCIFACANQWCRH